MVKIDLGDLDMQIKTRRFCDKENKLDKEKSKKLKVGKNLKKL